MLKEKSELFQYSLEQGKVRFEQGMKNFLKKQRTGIWHYLRTTPLRHLLSAPLVYALFVPIALIDFSVTLYQQICFRIYRIPRVHRSDYLILDRGQLAYLNAIEKINCIYCGYSNDVIEYVREVAARTEQYWCPIKHVRRSPDPHRHSQRFVDYGDVEGYRSQLEQLRQTIREIEKPIE